MIPDGDEWEEWDTRAKVEYLAQLATLLTLAFTVAFSFLGWREARKAAALQQDIFVAQSAPLLEVSETKIREYPNESRLQIHVTNVGGSTSRSFCLKVKDDRLQNTLGEFCDSAGDLPLSRMQIQKEKTFVYALPIRAEQQTIIGFVPAEARPVYPEREFKPCPGKEAKMITVLVTFGDFMGGRHGSIRQVLLCGQA